jgi:hypothetical protein
MMTVSQLIKQLEKLQEEHGDIDVMIDPQINMDGPWAVDDVTFREVEDDQCYPEEYDMPGGYKYLEIARWY